MHLHGGSLNYLELTLEKNVERFEALVSLLVQLRLDLFGEIEFDLAGIVNPKPSVLYATFRLLQFCMTRSAANTLSDNRLEIEVTTFCQYVTNELLYPLESGIMSARDVLNKTRHCHWFFCQNGKIF